MGEGDGGRDFEDELERARSGDVEALGRILEPELPRLLAFIRLRLGGRLGGRESSADVLQSVCREVLETLPRREVAGAAAFRRWVYAVATNRIRKKGRYHAAARRDLRRDDPASTWSRVDPLALSRAYGFSPTPSRIAIAHEEVARIESAFDALAPEAREALLLAHYEGLTHAEIGQRFGRSEAAIAKLIARAKVQIARTLAC